MDNFRILLFSGLTETQWLNQNCSYTRRVIISQPELTNVLEDYEIITATQ